MTIVIVYIVNPLYHIVWLLNQKEGLSPSAMLDNVVDAKMQPHVTEKSYDKSTCFLQQKTRKSCFSYRTGFHCSTVLLFLWNCFYCTAVSIKFLQFLWSFYCFNNVPPVLLFLQSFYCFFETSTVSKKFLHSTHCLSYRKCQIW